MSRITVRSLSKNKFILISKIAIALIAYIYIYYRISNYYILIKEGESLFNWNTNSNLYLSLSFLLMFINWITESYKWQIIVSKFDKISIFQAIQSVLFGLTAAVFTPYRLGEFIGRPMMFSEKTRIQATMAMLIGSLAQNAITICMAVLGIILYYFDNSNEISIISKNINLIGTILLSLCILILFLYLNPKFILAITRRLKFLKKWHSKFVFILSYNKLHLFYILLLSSIRYIVFFSQYFLLLKAFNVNIDILQAFSAISLSYVFLFSIPGIPIAEPGLRGSLALFFLGVYSKNDLGIFSASIGIWIINLALPSVIGTFLMYKVNKIKEIQSNFQ